MSALSNPDDASWRGPAYRVRFVRGAARYRTWRELEIGEVRRLVGDRVRMPEVRIDIAGRYRLTIFIFGGKLNTAGTVPRRGARQAEWLRYTRREGVAAGGGGVRIVEGCDGAVDIGGGSYCPGVEIGEVCGKRSCALNEGAGRGEIAAGAGDTGMLRRSGRGRDGSFVVRIRCLGFDVAAAVLDSDCLWHGNNTVPQGSIGYYLLA